MEEKKPSDRAGWIAILVFGALMILSAVLSMCTHKAHAAPSYEIGRWAIVCITDAETPKDIGRSAFKEKRGIVAFYRAHREEIRDDGCSLVDVGLLKAEAQESTSGEIPRKFQVFKATEINDDEQTVYHVLIEIRATFKE